MPVCVPIKDMRDTVAFSQLVEKSPEPITVTKNGYDQFVVVRSKDYDELRKAQARIQILERMIIAERERAEGLHIDAKDSIVQIRARYDL